MFYWARWMRTNLTAGISKAFVIRRTPIAAGFAVIIGNYGWFAPAQGARREEVMNGKLRRKYGIQENI